MAVFPSAIGALTAAAVLQRAAGHLTACTEPPFTGLRVGISAGDVEATDGDRFGMPVVEAARLCAVAEPRQILASSIVTALAGSRADGVFEPLVLHRLKGIPNDFAAAACRVDTIIERTRRPFLAAPPHHLVGRDEIIRDLLGRWSRTVAGGADAVLLCGDHGIGKTALLGATAHRMADDAPAFLIGRGRPGGGPFATLAAAVAEATHPSIEAHLGPLVADGQAADVTDSRSPDPVGDLVAAVQRISRDAPIVVMVDDLDDADPSTRRLLDAIVGAAVPGVSVLAVGRHEGLVRAGWTEVSLAALDGDDTAELVRSLAGSRREKGLDSAVLDLYRRSGGNPLLIRELLADLMQADGGDVGLRTDLRAVVSQRLEQLEPATIELLEIAAMMGRCFDVDVLGRVIGDDTFEVITALEPAEKAGLVSVTGEALLEFRLAVAVDVLSASVGELRRRRIHASIAAGLADGPQTSATPALVIHHLTEADVAGDPAELARWTARAVRTVPTCFDADAVAGLCATARDRLGRVTTGGDALDLQLRIAAAAAARTRAEPGWREDLRVLSLEADRRGEPALCIEAVVEMSRGIVTAALAVDDEYVGLLDRSLDHARRLGDEQAVATLLSLSAVEQVHALDVSERRRMVDEALGMSERLGDPRLRLRLLLARFVALDTAAAHLDGRRTAAEALRLAETTEEASTRFWAAAFGRIDAIVHAEPQVATELAQRARTLGGERPELRWHLDLLEVHDLITAGHLDEAFRRSVEAHERAVDVPDADLARFAQGLLIDRGRGDPAAVVEAVEPVATDPEGPTVAVAAMTVALVEMGELVEARRHVDALLERLPFNEDSFWLISMTLLGDAVAAVAPDRAPDIVSALDPYRDLVAAASVGSVGPVSASLGRLRRATGDDQGAAADLRDARRTAVAFEAPTWLDPIDRELAKLPAGD